MLKRLLNFFVQYHFAILLLMVALLLALEGLFLYRYFWKALTETRIVYELKQKVATEEFNTEIFARIKSFQTQKEKEKLLDFSVLRDPFISSSSSTRPQ